MTATKPTTFGELAPEVVKLGDEYLTKHPEPVLVLDPYGEGTKSLFDTPPDGNAGLDQTTTDLMAGNVFKQPMLGGLIAPTAPVVRLVKSDRNPFAGIITVGRANNNDVILNHPSVSKLHAVLNHLDGSWRIEDRNSTRGTLLEGVKLPPSQARAIDDGTAIGFGDVVSARFFSAESFYGICCLAGGGTFGG